MGAKLAKVAAALMALGFTTWFVAHRPRVTVTATMVGRTASAKSTRLDLLPCAGDASARLPGDAPVTCRRTLPASPTPSVAPCQHPYDGYAARDIGKPGSPALSPAQAAYIKKGIGAFPKADLRFSFDSNDCRLVLFDAKAYVHNDKVQLLDPDNPQPLEKRTPQKSYFDVYDKRYGATQRFAF